MIPAASPWFCEHLFKVRKQTNLIVYLAIVAVAIYLHEIVTHRTDINIHDEVYYEHLGNLVRQGKALSLPLAWSPTLATLYSIMPQHPLTGLRCDLMFLVALLASTSTLYWMLRWKRTLVLPALGCISWLSLPFVLPHMTPARGPSVYLWTACLYFLMAGYALRHRKWAVIAAATVLSIHRTEFAMILPATWALFGPSKLRTNVLFAGIMTVAIGSALALSSSVQERSWFAFRQHFASHASQLDPDRHESATYAFQHPDEYIAESFGDCHSIAEAFQTNRPALLGHAIANIANLPTGILRSVSGDPLFSLSIALVGCVLLMLSFRSGTLSVIHPVSGLLTIGALLSILSTILTRPRPELLVPVFSIAWVALTWLYTFVICSRHRIVRLSACAIAATSCAVMSFNLGISEHPSACLNYRHIHRLLSGINIAPRGVTIVGHNVWQIRELLQLRDAQIFDLERYSFSTIMHDIPDDPGDIYVVADAWMMSNCQKIHGAFELYTGMVNGSEASWPDTKWQTIRVAGPMLPAQLDELAEMETRPFLSVDASFSPTRSTLHVQITGGIPSLPVDINVAYSGNDIRLMSAVIDGSGITVVDIPVPVSFIPAGLRLYALSIDSDYATRQSDVIDLSRH